MSCPHGTRKRVCVECDGAGICIHKKRKERCNECGGNELCQHNTYKYRCYECNGKSICEHKKRKERCKKCEHLYICDHKNRKATCEECKQERLCQHSNTKGKCILCDPNCFHCEHNINKYICRTCSNWAYCKHNKYKPRCKECGGSALCQSEFCDKMAIKKYNNYCLTCCIHICPEIEVIRNYKTKERNVVEHVLTKFPHYSWTIDKKVEDGCSKRRPDLMLDYGTHIIIVEIDEYQHKDYDSTCENKRIMEISQDLQHRSITFIRFNPDSYKNSEGKTITSCWRTNKLGIYTVSKSKELEWKQRMNILFEKIQYCVNNPSSKTIDIIELFYS